MSNEHLQLTGVKNNFNVELGICIQVRRIFSIIQFGKAFCCGVA